MEIKQKKSTTVFETIDSGSLKHVETTSGNSYDELIVDFIRSLGFDVQYKYKSTVGLTGHITIDGAEAFLYTKACSYMAQSAYNRDIKPRKNRFFGIHATDTYSDKNLIRVPVNVEIDKEQLIKRITEFVNGKLNSKKSYEDSEKKKEDIFIKLKEHIKSSSLNKPVSSVSIKNGDLIISQEIGSICFDIESWSFKSFSPCKIPFSTLEEIMIAPDKALEISLAVQLNINLITSIGKCLTDLEVIITKSMDRHKKFEN